MQCIRHKCALLQGPQETQPDLATEEENGVQKLMQDSNNNAFNENYIGYGLSCYFQQQRGSGSLPNC